MNIESFSADIAIAAVDLLQEMTDVELTDESEDAVNGFIDALVSLACILDKNLTLDFCIRSFL